MIKVIIERTVAPDLEPNYKDTILSTLKAVLEAPGYVSSESLTDLHNSKHKVIITKWTSLAAWEAWHRSEARKTAVSSISLLLEEPEKITVLGAH